MGAQRHHADAFSWGRAHFTRKLQGWQVACRHPNHRDANGVLACKKFKTMNIPGGTERCLKLLKWWVCLGESKESKQEHAEQWAVIAAARLADEPSDQWLEEHKPADGAGYNAPRAKRPRAA